jgi:hypothetical protein
MAWPGDVNRESRMKWRIMMEFIGADGSVGV